MMYYTGIGARSTPKNILHQMFLYGRILSQLGFTLRSGAADGADSAFERGCDFESGKKEIYLPWQRFNNHASPLFNITKEAYGWARKCYGTRWDYIGQAVQKLMARNMYQVLGQDLNTPSMFVICWTPDGAKTLEERTRLTGGTGQAIACASCNNIPVFNFQVEDDESKLKTFIGDLI